MDHHPRSTGREDATAFPAATQPVARPATLTVQEDPVHPDLFLVVYRQQERELEHRLEHRRSQAARGDDPDRRPRHRGPLAALTAARRRP